MVRVLPPDVTVEVVGSGEGAIAEIANIVLRGVWIVRVEMLSQLELVEEGSAALLALEWSVVLVPQQMRHDLLAVRVELLAEAAAIRDVLFVMLSVANYIVERERDVGADGAVMLGRRMRLHMLDHLVVRAVDLHANHAQKFVVVGTTDLRFLQQLADQHVPLERLLRVELLVARLTHEVVA